MKIKTEKFAFILIITAILSGGVVYFFSNDIYKNIEDKDMEFTLGNAHIEILSNWDFYKNLSIILEATDPQFLFNLVRKFEDDEKFIQIISAGILYEVHQNKSTLKALEQFSSAFKEGKKKASMLDSNELFQKNTACSNLTSNIGKSLDKYKEFEFIFYSPTLNDCIYSISHKTNAKIGYKKSKVIFNATTQKKMEEYLVETSYNYEDILGNTEEDFSDQIMDEKQKYLDFILKNSLYNFDLLKNVSGVGNF